jgi:DNA-binding NtrC family response regulator
MPVIMMSGHATIDTAVEATRIGALDFLEKPITLQKLLKAVETGLQRGRGNDPRVASAPSGAPMRAVQGAYQASARVGVTVPGAHAQPSVTLVHPVPTVDTVEGGGYGTAPSAAHPGVPLAGAPIGVTPGHVGLRELPLDLPLREARDCFERAYFEHHLTREHGSMTRVAERTGLERTHLYRKLKQLGIDLSRGAYRKQVS